VNLLLRLKYSKQFYSYTAKNRTFINCTLSHILFLAIFFVLLHKISDMNFDIVIVGYLAGFCTAVAQFPQAYKIIRTGETHSISLGMYIIMTFGILFWFIYGVLIPDLPMIIANGICLIPSVYILFITIRNLNKAKNKIA
jgi:MtN3 and saliva related transmembrane protein